MRKQLIQIVESDALMNQLGKEIPLYIYEISLYMSLEQLEIIVGDNADEAYKMFWIKMKEIRDGSHEKFTLINECRKRISAGDKIRVFGKNNNRKTPFECLGIGANVTYKQIRSAYNRMLFDLSCKEGGISIQEQKMLDDVEVELISEDNIRKKWQEYVEICNKLRIKLFLDDHAQKTPFECLGVGADATMQQIEHAYEAKKISSAGNKIGALIQSKDALSNPSLRIEWIKYIKTQTKTDIFDRIHAFTESHKGKIPFDCLDLEKNIHATKEEIEQAYSKKVETLPDEASKTALKQARDELIGRGNIREEWEEYATRMYNRPWGP